MPPDARRHLGSLGEQLACEHLERLGLRILERNYRTRWGELDIIAADADRLLVFCEVKTRRAGQNGTPWDALTPEKRDQVRRIASRWLIERTDRPRACELRFDAIGVTIDPAGRLAALDHLEGAF